jgi:hypothetical protein
VTKEATVRTTALAWVAAAALGVSAAASARAEEGARCTWQEGSQIRILIHDLGSQDLATRQAAERALRAYGPKAHVALREASTHENREVRLRATQILRGDSELARGGGWVVWHEGLRVEMLPDRVRVLAPDGRLLEGSSIQEIQQRNPQIAARLRTLRVERMDSREGANLDRSGPDAFGRDDRFSAAGADERDRMGSGLDGHRDDHGADARGGLTHDDSDRMRSGQGFQDDRYGASSGRGETGNLRGSTDDRTGTGVTAGTTGDRYGSGAGTTGTPTDRYGSGAGTTGRDEGLRGADDRMGSGANAQTGPFGLQVRDLDDATRREKNLSNHEGVYVVTVQPQSKASNLGIRSGDLVTTVGGQAVRSTNDLQMRLRDAGDDDLTIVVIRDGETKTLRR